MKLMGVFQQAHVVKAMLEHECIQTIPHDVECNLGSSLAIAAQEGQTDVVNAMLEHKCIKTIPHDVNYSLGSSLAIAAKKGQTDVVNAMLEHECIQNIPTNSHWMGELIDEHKVALSEKKLTEASLKNPTEILPFFLGNLSYNEEILLPWYGRGY